jgi:hypothetical protein
VEALTNRPLMADLLTYPMIRISFKWIAARPAWAISAIKVTGRACHHAWHELRLYADGGHGAGVGSIPCPSLVIGSGAGVS